MYYLLNKSTNPYFNLALEEYLFLNDKYNDDIISYGEMKNPFL